MLAVQIRNPGKSYPPNNPQFPNWDDITGESVSATHEIYNKLASKRHDMVPFHAERLQSAGLMPSQSLQQQVRTPDASDIPQQTQQPVQAHEVIFGRPVAELGFDETGGMSAAAYETPSEEEYHSSYGGAQMSTLSPKVQRKLDLWAGGQRRMESGSRSSNYRRPTQDMTTSLSNIGSNVHNIAASSLQFLDGASSMVASGARALADSAQAGAVIAHNGAQVVGGVSDVIRRGRIKSSRFRPLPGGDDGDDSSSSGPPPLIPIEDKRSSSDSPVVRRPGFLAIQDRQPEPAEPRARKPRRPHWMGHVAEGRAYVSRTSNGLNSLSTLGTRGSHRGPGG